MNTYTQKLANDITAVANDTAARRSASVDIARFFFDLSGPVFFFALLAGLGLTIAFTVAESLSVGTSLMLSLIKGLLLSGTWLLMAEGGGPSYLGAVKSLNPISSAVVNGIEQIVGGSQGQEGTDFTALATILGVFTTSWAASSVETAWASPYAPQWTDTVGAALGILAIVEGAAAAQLGSLAGTYVSSSFRR